MKYYRYLLTPLIFLFFGSSLRISFSYPYIWGFLPVVGLFFILILYRGKIILPALGITLCSALAIGDIVFSSIFLYLSDQFWLGLLSSGWFVLPYFLEFLSLSLFIKFSSRLNPILEVMGVASILAVCEQTLFFVFPWSFAHNISGLTPLIQLVELGGYYFNFSWGTGLVSFCLAITSGWGVYSAVLLFQKKVREAFILFSLSLFVLGGWYGYGVFQLQNLEQKLEQSSEKLDVALIQPNLPSSSSARFFSKKELKNGDYLSFTLTRKAIRKQPSTQLVVWPESSLRKGLEGNDIVTKRLGNLSSRNQVHLLLNVPEQRRSQKNYFQFEYYNSSYWINPKGEISGKYQKQLLFPLGETSPFDESSSSKIFLKAGKKLEIFSLQKKIQVIPAICYESFYAQHFQRGVQAGGNLAVVQASLRDFGKTPATAIHRSILVFHAIQFRIPILFASNTGLTSIISPVGKIVDELPNLYEKNYLVSRIQVPSN